MTRPKIRCAIYTRKSTEEGLDQDFNSLDAQYEACSLYIARQRHEGWKLAATRYDDGGISGGTLQRPALQNLLSDIDAGLIDLVVVYKIDRLTRSLSDFSKIVDRLDAKQASIVFITLSFNTATSMGRLTLNMLLSFAQFEREVTAERIRDKIAASKAKRLWMGGTVPLGYAPNPDKALRGLVIREDEVATVKAIFEIYIATGCLSRSERSLASQRRTGRIRTNGLSAPLSRGAIHKILTNPIYIGKICHKDKVYQGQHAPIISECIWDEVQTKLQSNSQERRGRHLPAAPLAWLRGKIYDPKGDQLTPTHTRKNGRKIRYYISNRLLNGKDPTGYRLPALVLEQQVCELIAAHLKTATDSGRLLNEPTIEDVASMQRTVSKEFTPSSKMDPEILQSFACINERGDIRDGSSVLRLCRSHLEQKLDLDPKTIVKDSCAVTAPLTLRKRGVEQKVVLGALSPEPDRVLQNALSAAHLWLDQVKAGTTIAQISKTNATSESLIRTRIRLAFLCPKIQAGIMDGTLPPNLTLVKLLRIKIDPSWKKQEQKLLR